MMYGAGATENGGDHSSKLPYLLIFNTNTCFP